MEADKRLRSLLEILHDMEQTKRFIDPRKTRAEQELCEHDWRDAVPAVGGKFCIKCDLLQAELEAFHVSRHAERPL